MEWKWTKGEPYERSRRIFKETADKESEKFNKEIEKSAYSTSLNHDENTWDISNKREDLDTKMADRDMVQQIGNNPFLSETNYVNDVSIRDQFLKPINTAGDRAKNNDFNEVIPQ